MRELLIIDDFGLTPLRSPRPTKLDPYKGYLLERIAAAAPHWIPATVLLREIHTRGYEGGISQLKAFLAPHKQQPLDPVVRFETAPGQQMQANFTTIRRGHRLLKAFVATLGYSRATYVLFTEHEDGESWLRGLRGAFAYFGGIPEEVLFDNARAIIIERDAYGDGRHRCTPPLARGVALRLGPSQPKSARFECEPPWSIRVKEIWIDPIAHTN